jgi:hypothetical protein
MGLFFRSRRRGSGGFGLLFWLVVIIVGSIYVTKHSGAVQTSCMNFTQSVGGYGGALCRTLADVAATVAHGARMVANVTGMEWLDEYRNDWSLKVDNSGIREKWRSIGAQLDEATNISSVGGGVSMDSVQPLMGGGGMPSFGGGSLGQYKGAMSYFMAGQKLMSGPGGFGGQSSSGSAALDWYKKGASMGQYGLLSQVKLGSMYMTGNGGVTPDYGQAYSYNLQALSSLKALQASGTPEAQMTLDALPVSATELQLQLNKAIGDLKYRMQTGQ